MDREVFKKYLRVLGQELQKRDVTGQILLAEGVMMLLDVRKPKVQTSISAYLKGDKSAMVPKGIDAYFLPDFEAVTKAAAIVTEREGLEDSWFNSAAAAFCAAMVEWLRLQAGMPSPAWTNQDRSIFPETWFSYEEWSSRSWLLATTPAPFQRRNIFGGDRMFLHKWDIAKQMQQSGKRNATDTHRHPGN